MDALGRIDQDSLGRVERYNDAMTRGDIRGAGVTDSSDCCRSRSNGIELKAETRSGASRQRSAGRTGDLPTIQY